MAYDPKNGGAIFPTTGTPAATVGVDGDYAIDKTTAGGPYIYGPKAGGVWPTAMGLGGAAGTPGNLYLPIPKSASASVLAADLTGSTPAYVYDCSGGTCTHTTDASLLWNSGTSQSKVTIVKRIDSTPANSLIFAAASGQTIDGGSTVTPAPTKIARRIFATSATALVIE